MVLCYQHRGSEQENQYLVLENNYRLYTCTHGAQQTMHISPLKIEPRKETEGSALTPLEKVLFCVKI